MNTSVVHHHLCRLVYCLGVIAALLPVSSASAADVSPPVILQYFESRWTTIENRMPDIHKVGYGALYTPPPGQADQGDFSVGYDPYDRFDLGSPSNPTMYGTKVGLKAMIKSVHMMGGNSYLDLVWNHSGYSKNGQSDGNGNSFYNAGGYPGLNVTLPNDVDGDYHGAFEGGDEKMRLAGLLDIAQEKNYQMIRSPVEAGNPDNIRAGTVPAFGRIANVPNPNNARLYPDKLLTPIMVYDPVTGEQNIPIYPFNLQNPMAGDAVKENALGYLMRNTRWLVEVIGADGFRVDAGKNMPVWVQNYLDRAVYRASNRYLLNGEQMNVFSFNETYDGNQDYLQNFVRKDINPNDPGRIGGNRDTMDFPLFFAMRDNLTGNGLQNNWYNIKDASFDKHDDGKLNGSQGVKFVQSQDNGAPHLSNVAYAYELLMPGNAMVYFNAKEFGNNRDFPQDGRGDALGGFYGEKIPKLVDIRNTHGRGNYQERWVEKENFAFEREKSMVVLLSNRVDAGFDSRTIQTSFAPGTPLLELTGNANNPAYDPNDNIPGVVVVNNDGTINVRFLRNVAPGTSNFTGAGYLVYGVAGPQGTLSLTNVASTLEGGTPTADTNDTTRLADVSVIKGNNFSIKLKTKPVNLLGVIRDADADGDNAVVKIDGGRDINGNGKIDVTDPGSTAYGFDDFKTKKSPLVGGGDGEYIQDIDASKLSEGYHYITVRAYRHRDDGGPAVWTDFKDTIYVDRLKPISIPVSGATIDPGVNENRRLRVRSIDQTANSVHALPDIGAALTDQQVLAMLGGSTQLSMIDRDLFTKDYFNITNGNHTLTLVSFEITGTYNIQRYTNLQISTIYGAGLGDTNFDSRYTKEDVFLFGNILDSMNVSFNPGSDLNGDGLVNMTDLNLLGPRLELVGADQETMNAYMDLVASHSSLMAMAVPLESMSIEPQFYADFAQTVPEPGALAWVLALGSSALLKRPYRRQIVRETGAKSRSR